jgi:hypothetical protein
VQLRSQMSSWISLTQTRCSHATSWLTRYSHAICQTV